MSHRGSILIATSLLLVTCTNAHKRDTKPQLVITPPKAVSKKLIIVAVIDTGIDTNLLKGNSYCKDGHVDFSDTGLQDTHGHGTHISGLIDQYAKNYIFGKGIPANKIDDISLNYCQIIIKYYNPKATGEESLARTIQSFRWAIDHHANIINYSGGGSSPSPEEKELIVEALNKGIKVVAAAGNDGIDIDNDPCKGMKTRETKVSCKQDYPNKYGTYYPAMYDSRIYIVGNLVSYDSGKIAKTSNYGDRVTYWEVGTDVLSRLPSGQYGYMTGTSQATAIKSGKLVREMLLYR